MAYVSGKDGAHPQETRCKNRASERMPNLKLSFLLGVRLIYVNPIPKLNVGFSFIDFCGAATIMSAIEDKLLRWA